VKVVEVDTTDPNNPIVAIEVTSNMFSDPLTTVIFEINGSTSDWSSYYGDARYQFHMPPLGNFANGTFQITGKACSAVGDCITGDAYDTIYAVAADSEYNDLCVMARRRSGRSRLQERSIRSRPAADIHGNIVHLYRNW
jgi:hypothetical protein